MIAYERASYVNLEEAIEFLETKSVEDSQTALLRALQAGKIVATGRRIAFNPSDIVSNHQYPRHLRDMGERETIASHAWADLIFGTAGDGALGALQKLQPSQQGFGGIRLKRRVDWREAWGDLLFARTEVETTFQPNTPQAILNPPILSKTETGKQPLVIERLRTMFPDGVPKPAFEPRKALIRKLIDTTPGLGGILDDDTLKKAITAYNNSLQSNGT